MGTRKPPRQGINPQTGEQLSNISEASLRAQKHGAAARLVGLTGEQFVRLVFPHWRPAKPYQEGFDFEAPVFGKGKIVKFEKVEVKTLGKEEIHSKKMLAQMIGGHWHNEICDRVLVVSTGGIWNADAIAFRRYLIHHMNQFPVAKERSFREPVWMEISLDRLISLGILRPTNVSIRHFHRLWKEKSRESRAKK